MKTEGQVKQQLKQAIFRHQKKLLKTGLREAPETCRHNGTLEPMVGELEAPSVQACFFTTDGVPRGVVCDVRYDNGARARGCPLWEPRVSKDSLKEEFQALVQADDRGKIAAEYPDLAALMWVLDPPPGEGGVVGTEDPSQEEMEADPDTRGWDWGSWPWSRARRRKT